LKETKVPATPTGPPVPERPPTAATAQLTRTDVPTPRQADDVRTLPPGTETGAPLTVVLAPRLSGWPLAAVALGAIVATYTLVFLLLAVVKADPRTTGVLVVLSLSAVAAFVGMFVLSSPNSSRVVQKLTSAAAGAISGWKR
jgi:hypothetical protein